MQPETYAKGAAAQDSPESKQADVSTATRKPFNLLSLNDLPAFGNTR
jgi:hypothetical protein